MFLKSPFGEVTIKYVCNSLRFKFLMNKNMDPLKPVGVGGGDASAPILTTGLIRTNNMAEM